MKRCLLYCLMLVCSNFTLGQESSVSISQNSIYIGEKVLISYSIAYTGNKKPLFSPQTNHLPARTKASNGVLSKNSTENIEILTPFRDTVYTYKDKNTWVGMYEVTAWDSGNYVIEPATIYINDSLNYFPQIELKVKLVDAVKNQDIYGIKESFANIPDEPFSFTKFIKSNWWWMLLLLLIPVYFIL